MGLTAALLGMLAWTIPASAQTYTPTNWVKDPFSDNPNYIVVGPNTANPSFNNDGTDRGTLFANSPIGATIVLTNPGDTIDYTGQVTISGSVNTDGDMQFRIGLFYQGTNSADTNWLGYMFGNATGAYAGTTDGLYVRNNPNQGTYSSGSPGNAMRPSCGSKSYDSGWDAGTYNFSLSVTLLPSHAHLITWKLAGVSPTTYLYAGSYTNSFPLTIPPAFDQVGIMGGSALFNTPATANRITFKNLKVNFGK